jgi:hypothetical protein
VLNPIKFQNVETMDASQKLNLIQIQKLGEKKSKQVLKEEFKKVEILDNG